MKTIGLIGGLSWQSTALYYRYLNQEINNRLGENHSGKILLYSFNFQEIASLQHRGLWDELCQKMEHAAQTLQNAHSDIILICSNTMHRCFGKIKDQVTIPLLHIAESTGNKLIRSNIKHAGLLGTRFLLQTSLYQEILREQFNISVAIPSPDQTNTINHIIYQELVKGILRDESRGEVMKIISEMHQRGIEAIILGCTEIPLLIRQEDCEIPVIDTTYNHAMSAVDISIGGPVKN
jgi:aspartate racemase